MTDIRQGYLAVFLGIVSHRHGENRRCPFLMNHYGEAVAVMKHFLIAFAVVLASPSAFAIEISEGMLNKFVEQAFAEKTNRDIQLLNPKVSLLDGFATLCAKVHTKAFPKDVDFCADMTPKWRQETGSLLATKMALVSLNAPGVSEKNIELVKMIVNQIVLPGLEGIEVYKADNFIGKQISSVKVMPGILDLSI